MIKSFINIYQQKFTYHPYYQKIFWELVKKWVNVYVFVKNSENKKLGNWIEQKTFSSKEDLIQQISKLNESFYLNTFEEHSISLITEIKKHFNQPFTTYYQAFTNKDLQRQLLLKEDKSITTNFIETSLDNIDFEKIEQEIHYPLVIKPVSAAQSRWVAIIKNKQELEKYIKDYSKILERISSQWYKNEKFLIEEFIDGTAWSVDYFVDENQNFYIAKPVFLEFGIDIGIDDFCNISRLISFETDKALDLENLKIFIEKNVKALDIKNTFVHHEFKFTSKWVFKTIELNGRIWGFRIDMYDKAYNLNLLDSALWNYKSWFLENPILTNYSVWAIYPQKKWILKEFNKELIERIKKLPSLEQIKLIENKIQNEIWPSKEGFTRVGFIRLNNKDLEQFKTDYEFVKENYKDLVVLD